MDLSKLPRMSNTPSPPPADPQPTEAPPVAAGIPNYAQPERPGGAVAEAWISIGIGVIVILLQQRCLSWFSSRWFGSQFTWTFSDGNGPLAYPDTYFYGHDLGLVLFGVAMILDGILLFTRRRIPIAAGLVLVSIATLWNLYTVIHLYSIPGFGLQLFPALAVAIGVYIAMCLWRQFKLAGRRA